MKISDYLLGLMYANGKMQDDMFLVTFHTKELAQLVEEKLQRLNIFFSKKELKQNEEVTQYIIRIYDIEVLDEIKAKGILSVSSKNRIKCNSQFIRGYFEQKGSLAQYSEKGSVYWEVRFYGIEEDLEVIQNHLCSLFEIHKNQISKAGNEKHRKSSRFTITNRKDVATFVDYIELDFNISPTLFEKIQNFKQWHSETPYRVRKVYKNFKSATQYMARELQIHLKGIVGGNNTVYLYEGEKVVNQFEGWEGAYSWTAQEFKKVTNLNPPIVEC